MTARIRDALLCLAAITFLATGCARKEAEPAGPGGPGGAMQALPVTVIEVHTRKVPVSLEAVGQASGSREVQIRARVTGIIEKRIYDEGAPVKEGAVLFTIEREPYELAVEQAKAALQQDKVRRDLAAVDAKRLEPLAREKAISERELDQALATEKTAAAAIASDEAKLREAQLNLSWTRVTAPIAGITGRALQSEGALVTANTDSAFLTTLTQVDPVWVLFPLAESDYQRVRGVERSARVQLVDGNGKVEVDHGKLNFASTTVDPKT
ncbi:MAG TPA: efflux RND transporter periplasmic adaptor subunit, partial [Usitatibacter sp.]|nr:efflux RND transporter periplasmic adaptor subunit [Usitatibacter sp.]